MIRRLLAAAVLVWILGFAWFAILLPQPADLSKTDAIVVLTGGSGRIERGLQLLEAGQAQRMLISGVDRDVRTRELVARYPGREKLFACCIELGFHAVDTHSNGIETSLWVKKYKINSIRLVTSDWHMRRARLEQDRALPERVIITNDAVMTQPSLASLFKEYNKYWARGFTALLGF
jgi:uncharacterized SAM-binding protein YcdF (DUF218 family)